MIRKEYSWNNGNFTYDSLNRTWIIIACYNSIKPKKKIFFSELMSKK